MGQHTVRMETFSAQPEAPIAVCQRAVASADVLVVIVAWRYGWIPPVERGGDGVKSITRIEVEAAIGAHIPVLAFVVDSAFPWPSRKEQDALIDAETPAEALQIKKRVDALKAFKAYLGTTLTVETFTTPEDLAMRVCASLGRWLQSRTLAGAIDLGEGSKLTAVHYANEAYLYFTVSNLSDAPQKVALALDVVEVARSSQVAIKKAGAILRDFDVDVSLNSVGRLDLLAGRGVQVVLLSFT
jgi:hypothetical protein